jgi:hypothetical protein
MVDVRHLHLRFTENDNLHQDHSNVIAMWDAIRTSCPQLEEVTFTGSDTSRAYDSVRQFMGSEWPALRRLAVGEIDFKMASPAQSGSSFKSQFFRFLESHDSIKDLHLSGKVHLVPKVFTAMSRSALPNVKQFRGAWIFSFLSWTCDKHAQAQFSRLQHFGPAMPLFELYISPSHYTSTTGLLVVLSKCCRSLEVSPTFNYPLSHQMRNVRVRCFMPCSPSARNCCASTYPSRYILR